MNSLYKIDDRELLANLLSGAGAFLGLAVVLDGLTAEQALAKPHGLPHSIADIVDHMCYWQEWFNNCVTKGFSSVPEHAAVGWPASPDGWDSLRARYLAALDESKRIVTESESLGDSLLPPGVPIPLMTRSRSAPAFCMRLCTAAITWDRSSPCAS